MGGGGPSKKITLMRGGGHAKKIGNCGGVIQFLNYTPPNPTSPPYAIKNERSLTFKKTKKNNNNIITFLSPINFKIYLENLQLFQHPGGRVLPYISLIAICHPKGFRFAHVACSMQHLGAILNKNALNINLKSRLLGD